MNKTKLGWCAGIIDGEGCIFINFQKYKNKSPSFRLYVKVAMGHEGAIKRLRAFFGCGSIHIVPTKRHNPAWAWLISTRDAEKVLLLVRKHLLVKAAEADVALNFCKLTSGCVGGAGGNAKLDPALLQAKYDCYASLRKLKPRFRFDQKRFPLRTIECLSSNTKTKNSQAGKLKSSSKLQPS